MIYLGDSVYAEIEHGMVKLTTDNGLGPSNTIYLEPEVYEALTLFVKRARGDKAAEAQQAQQAQGGI